MKIEYPKKVSEIEIQAEVWHRLKELGIDARLEVQHSRNATVRFRLDIVIFKNQLAMSIIECKSWSKSYLRKQRYHQYKKTKQYLKYNNLFGLPIFVCGCQSSIEPAIHFAIQCCKQSSALPICA